MIRKNLGYVIEIGTIGLSTILLIKNYSEIKTLYVSVFTENLIYFFTAMVLYFLLIRRSFSFYEIFIHELTHLFFSFLFFERIKSFFASQTHGELVTNEYHKNIITGLSPYFFPLITLLLIAVWPSRELTAFKIVVPFSFGLFWAVVIKQTVKQWRELLSFGWHGLLFVVKMNLWVSMFVFAWYSNKIEEIIRIIKL